MIRNRRSMRKKHSEISELNVSCRDLGKADHEGWLSKKAGGHSLIPVSWKRYWCVLKKGNLYCFKTSFDIVADYYFPTKVYEVESGIEKKKVVFKLTSQEENKKAAVFAGDKTEIEKWIDIIKQIKAGTAISVEEDTDVPDYEERRRVYSCAARLQDDGKRRPSSSAFPANAETTGLPSGFGARTSSVSHARVSKTSSNGKPESCLAFGSILKSFEEPEDGASTPTRENGDLHSLLYKEVAITPKDTPETLRKKNEEMEKLNAEIAKLNTDMIVLNEKGERKEKIDFPALSEDKKSTVNEPSTKKHTPDKPLVEESFLSTELESRDIKTTSQLFRDLDEVPKNNVTHNTENNGTEVVLPNGAAVDDIVIPNLSINGVHNEITVENPHISVNDKQPDVKDEDSPVETSHESVNITLENNVKQETDGSTGKEINNLEETSLINGEVHLENTLPQKDGNEEIPTEKTVNEIVEIKLTSDSESNNDVAVDKIDDALNSREENENSDTHVTLNISDVSDKQPELSNKNIEDSDNEVTINPGEVNNIEVIGQTINDVENTENNSNDTEVIENDTAETMTSKVTLTVRSIRVTSNQDSTDDAIEKQNEVSENAAKDDTKLEAEIELSNDTIKHLTLEGESLSTDVNITSEDDSQTKPDKSTSVSVDQSDEKIIVKEIDADKEISADANVSLDKDLIEVESTKGKQEMFGEVNKPVELTPQETQETIEKEIPEDVSDIVSTPLMEDRKKDEPSDVNQQDTMSTEKLPNQVENIHFKEVLDKDNNTSVEEKPQSENMKELPLEKQAEILDVVIKSESKELPLEAQADVRDVVVETESKELPLEAQADLRDVVIETERKELPLEAQKDIRDVVIESESKELPLEAQADLRDVVIETESKELPLQAQADVRDVVIDTENKKLPLEAQKDLRDVVIETESKELPLEAQADLHNVVIEAESKELLLEAQADLHNVVIETESKELPLEAQADLHNVVIETERKELPLEAQASLHNVVIETESKELPLEAQADLRDVVIETESKELPLEAQADLRDVVIETERKELPLEAQANLHNVVIETESKELPLEAQKDLRDVVFETESKELPLEAQADLRDVVIETESKELPLEAQADLRDVVIETESKELPLEAQADLRDVVIETESKELPLEAQADLHNVVIETETIERNKEKQEIIIKNENQEDSVKEKLIVGESDKKEISTDVNTPNSTNENEAIKIVIDKNDKIAVNDEKSLETSITINANSEHKSSTVEGEKRLSNDELNLSKNEITISAENVKVEESSTKSEISENVSKDFESENKSENKKNVEETSGTSDASEIVQNISIEEPRNEEEAKEVDLGDDLDLPNLSSTNMSLSDEISFELNLSHTSTSST